MRACKFTGIMFLHFIPYNVWKHGFDLPFLVRSNHQYMVDSRVQFNDIFQGWYIDTEVNILN